MSLTDASENLELEDKLDLEEEEEDEPLWADLLSVAPDLPASLTNKHQTTASTTPTTDDGAASEATSRACSPVLEDLVDASEVFDEGLDGEDQNEVHFNEAEIKRPILRRRKARSIVRTPLTFYAPTHRRWT